MLVISCWCCLVCSRHPEATGVTACTGPRLTGWREGSALCSSLDAAHHAGGRGMRRRRLRRTRADCPLCGMVRRAARPTQGPRQRCVGAPLTDPAVGSVSLGGSLVRTCLAPSPSRLLHVPSGAMDSRYVREADGVPGQGAPGELLLCNLSDELDSRGKQSDSVKNSIIHILVIRQKA